MWRVLGIEPNGDLWMFRETRSQSEAIQAASHHSRNNINDPVEDECTPWRYFVVSQEEWESYWKEEFVAAKTREAQREGWREPSPAAP